MASPGSREQATDFTYSERARDLNFIESVCFVSLELSAKYQLAEMIVHYYSV